MLCSNISVRPRNWQYLFLFRWGGTESINTGSHFTHHATIAATRSKSRSETSTWTCSEHRPSALIRASRENASTTLQIRLRPYQPLLTGEQTSKPQLLSGLITQQSLL